MGGDSLFMLTPPKNAKLLRRQSAPARRAPIILIRSRTIRLPSLLTYKHRLHGIAFPSPEELFAAIHEIVGAIQLPTLEEVPRHWMERLE
jgi:hypothetical protein